MARELTLKQQRFVHHYVQSGNGTQAVLAAGYNTQHPHAMFTYLKRNPLVKERVLALENQQLQRIQQQAAALAEGYLSLIDKASEAGDYVTTLKALNKVADSSRIIEKSLTAPLSKLLAADPVDWDQFLNQLIRHLLVVRDHTNLLNALELRLRFRDQQVSALECRKLLGSVGIP